MPIQKNGMLVGFLAGAVAVGTSAALWKMQDDYHEVRDVCSAESGAWRRGQRGAKTIEEMPRRFEACVAGQGANAWWVPVEYLF